MTNDRGRRLAGFLDRRRRLVFALSLVVAVGGAMLAARLRLRPDFADLLPPSARSVRELRAVQERAQVSGTVLIGIEAEPAVRARAAEVLAAELARLDPELVSEIGIDDRVPRQFVWSHRFLYAPLDDLRAARDALQSKLAEVNPFFVPLEEEKPADPRAELERLRDRLNKARREADSPSPRVSDDGRLQLIIVRSRFPSDDSAAGRRLLEQIHAALDRTRAAVPEVDLGLAGDVVGTVAQQRGLVRGMLIAVGLTVVLVFAALLWFYRSLVAVLALLWALAVGTLAAFAFAKLAIGQLNLASAFLSSIVVGNGINPGIMLLARHLEERRRGNPAHESLARAISATVPATLAANAAAAIAYASLAITQFRGFRDFGMIGGVGMVMCWLSTYTVLPAVLSACERRGWIRPGRDPGLGRVLQRIVPRRPRVVAWAALGAFAVMGGIVALFLAGDPIETNLRNIRSTGPEFERQTAWMRKIDRAFGSGLSGGFVIATPSQARAAEVVERLREVDRGKPEEERLFSQVSSVADLLPKDQQEKLDVLADIRRLSQSKSLELLEPEDRQLLDELRPPENLRPLDAYVLPTELAWPYTERDGTRGRLVLANAGRGVDTWNLNDLRRFAARVRALDLGPEILVGGPAFIFSDMLDAMYRDGPLATLAAAAGATLVVLLLGVRRLAGPTLFCGALGTLSMVAIASLVGVKVNFLDFVALPITIGVGIDYAVNIAVRARQEPRLERVVGATGSAVLIESYTTTVGYGSLLLSRNRGIHSFGLAAMLGELTCLIVALVVAPALLRAADHRHATAGAPGNAGEEPMT